MLLLLLSAVCNDNLEWPLRLHPMKYPLVCVAVGRDSSIWDLTIITASSLNLIFIVMRSRNFFFRSPDSSL